MAFPAGESLPKSNELPALMTRAMVINQAAACLPPSMTSQRWRLNFNTDQGSQFTSMSFTNILKDHGIKISMDGKGRWMDNVFIERLWRSLKYECVYLNNLENGWQAKVLIGNWISHYNEERPHSSFDGQTPHEVYVKTKNLNGALHSEIRLAA